MDFLMGVLLVYGITNIVVQGSIFDGFKDWLADKGVEKEGTALGWFITKFSTLIECPMCTGFQVGWCVGVFLGPFVWYSIIFNGAIYSGTTWLIHCLVQFLGNGDDPARNIVVMTDSPIALKHINKEDTDDI